MDAKELVKTIKHLEINTNRRVNEMFAGNYKSSFRGQGLEVSDLRQYEEGDDARHIDWLITARQGRAYVKKFQETRELTTMILIDLSGSMDFTTADKLKSRVALETAAYLMFSALKNNDKFGAILYTDKVRAYVPPKKGKSQLLRILREIIQGYESQKGCRADLKTALDFLNLSVKKRSICFLVADSLAELEDRGRSGLVPLKIANQKHDFIYINIYDDFEKGIKDPLPLLRLSDPESGETRVFDLADKDLIARYNARRREKEAKEQAIVRKNRIDRLALSTTSNIYKELLLFFKKRALRY